MLPNINQLVPSGAGEKPLDKDAHVYPNRELRVLIVSPQERVLHQVIPDANAHIVGAGKQQTLSVRRELNLANSISVAVEGGEGNPEGADIPDPDGLVDGGGGKDAVVVLVPVAGEDLVVVCGEDHGGTGLADVPDADGAVAGGGGEDVGVAGVPDGGVYAVGVLGEGAKAGGAVDSPELNGVVPGGAEEGVSADGVVVHGLCLAGVLVEGPNRVGRGREGDVEELDGAVGNSGHQEGVVGLGPGHVVDAVSGVEGGDLGDGGGGRGGGGREEVNDVEAAVSEDAEVLGGGDGEAGLVVGAEFHGVAVERGFEDWHLSLGFLNSGSLQCVRGVPSVGFNKHDLNEF